MISVKYNTIVRIKIFSLILLYQFQENVSPPQVCEICSGVFTSEGELMNHNDTDHPERSLRCNLCLKVFSLILYKNNLS